MKALREKHPPQPRLSAHCLSAHTRTGGARKSERWQQWLPGRSPPTQRGTAAAPGLLWGKTAYKELGDFSNLSQETLSVKVRNPNFPNYQLATAMHCHLSNKIQVAYVSELRKEGKTKEILKKCQPEFTNSPKIKAPDV